MDVQELKKVHRANIGIMDVVETSLVDWLMKVGQDDWETLHVAMDKLDDSDQPEDEVVAALAIVGLQYIAGLCIDNETGEEAA